MDRIKQQKHIKELKKIVDNYNLKAKFVHDNEEVLEQAHNFGIMKEPHEFYGISILVDEICFEFNVDTDDDLFVQAIYGIIKEYGKELKNYTYKFTEEFYEEMERELSE